MDHSPRFSVGLPRPRRRPAGLIASALFHGLLLFLLVRAAAMPWDAARAAGLKWLTGSGGGGGGGGAANITYVELPSAPAAPAAEPQPVTPPVETPVEPPVKPPEQVTPPTITPPQTVAVAVPRPVRPDSVPAAGSGGQGAGQGPGSGGGSGGGTGGGIGPGTGPGTGPGNGGGGDGGSVRAPEWVHGAFPFETPPKALRGQQVTVTFWVAADGRVARFEVTPPIADHDYSDKFAAVMETFRFKPARGADGSAVPGVAQLTWTLQSK